MSETARCRSCNTEIRWVQTKSGKAIPCDLGEFPVIPDSAGDVLAVSDDGEVFRGRKCSESYENERWVYAMTSHFATCPEADKFRRSKS